MEEGKSSIVLPFDSIESIPSIPDEEGYPFAAKLSPSPELEAKPQKIADKGNVGLSEATLQDILQRFKNLDKSSSQFPNQLIDLLSGEEYKFCITRFQGEDAAWLIDYLDEVCVYIALHLHSAELLQVLDALDPVGPAHQKCLRELQEICGARRKLPRSYIPRCMDDTPGNVNCGPGEIFWWSLNFGVEFRRMFSLHNVFSPEGTEVGGTFLASPAFPALLTKATAPSQCY